MVYSLEDHFKGLRETIECRQDLELLALWDEATRKDLGPDGNGSWERMMVWDLVLSGRWDAERRERQREQKRLEKRRAALKAAREVMLERQREPADAANGADVGRNVAAERVRAGLTQLELAVAAEFARSPLARIESGDKRLTFDEACRLARALGRTLDAFA